MQRESIYGLMASILHLGNINFENDDSRHATIAKDSNKCIVVAANLLAIDVKRLENAFLKCRLIMPNMSETEVKCVQKQYIR